MDHDREPGHRPERRSRERAPRTATEPPELVEVTQPWWRGYFQGWSDHDAGIAPTNDFGDAADPWAAGYDAGWIAYCCEAEPRTSDCVGAGLGGHPAWN